MGKKGEVEIIAALSPSLKGREGLGGALSFRLAVGEGVGSALTGMLYLVRYRVLMATLVPHRQHSFMSPATWHARQ